MKKVIAAFFPWLLLGFGYKAMAQEEIRKENKKECLLEVGNKRIERQKTCSSNAQNPLD